jgi:hypothetical protein
VSEASGSSAAAERAQEKATSLADEFTPLCAGSADSDSALGSDYRLYSRQDHMM